MRIRNLRVRFVVAACAWSMAGTLAAGPIEDLQPGHWYEIPNSKMQSVLPSPEPAGNTGYRAIIDTWNGGAYDSKRDRLIVWGGGHQDYSGNELYVFNVTTFQWTRLTNPSTNTSGSGAYYSDGQPRSRHTYEVLEYLPDPVDRFCSFGASATYPQSNYFRNVDCFDFNTNTWSLRTNVPTVDYGGITGYDATTGLLWHHSTATGRVSSYNWAQDRWTSGDADDFISYELTGEFDPVRKELIGIGGGGGRNGVVVWSGAGMGSATNLSTTGHDGVINVLNPGVQWDPILQRIVVWASGPNLYSLDRSTRVWQKHTPAANNTVVPTAPAERGSFGRFRYMPRYNAYIVVNDINDNVFVYKLTANSGVIQPTVTLSAAPTSVQSQGSTTLTWSSSNADSCTASGGWTGAKATAGSEVRGPLTANTTFTLTCTNNTGGSAGQSVTVTVASSTPPPTVDLTATPVNVALNANTTLNWTTSNATSCTASGGWSGTKSTQGSQSVGPVTGQTTYTLTCTGAGGTTPDSVTVTVVAAPAVTISANPATVQTNGSSTLTWSTTNAASCSASGAWSGNKALSGSQSTGALTATSTFTLGCTGVGGSGSGSTTVTVSATPPPPPPAPTVTLTANPTAVRPNESSTLTWSSTNATSCTAMDSWTGSKATSGNESTGALTNTATYTLACSGSGGTAQQTVTITVTAGGGGGGSGTDSSGGGALGFTTLGALLALMLRRRNGLRPAVSGDGVQALLQLVKRMTRSTRTIGCAAALFATASVSAGTDVTTLTVYNDSGQAASNAPVTFGQVFRPGDVISGAGIEARLGDGTPVTLQIDKLAAHGDGSLRHAVITARIPALAAGATQSLILANAPSGSPGSPVALSALLATSFDAVVRLSVGGVPYSTSARDLLAGSPRVWLQGPLVSEWIVRGPLRTVAGLPHTHLTATFTIRAYAGSPIQRARVDVAVENTKTFAAAPGTTNYDATIEIGGSAAFTRNGMAHHQRSRWHKVLWWGSDPGISVAHQSTYLRATKAVPNYDPQLVISNAVLNSALSEWNSAPNAPLQAGLVSKDMPATGGRPEIGPLPRWDARHVISQDPRARPAVLGNGDLSGSWPIHYRDEGIGLPVSIDTNPQIWTNNLPGGLGERDTTAGYTPDWSHQPALGYYPYLITGDYYYLEEVQFWANWNMISRSPESGNRNGAQGQLDGDQVRALGWNLRTLAHAAWITPDNDPLKGYFENKLDHNFNRLVQRYITNNEAPLGHVTPNYLETNQTAAWMDDFVTQAIGWAHDLGYAKATNLMRSWKGRYVVDRLGDGGSNTGCWAMSAPYRSIWATDPNETALTNARDAYVRTAVLRFGSSTGNSIANATCGSAQQFQLMGLAQNEIFGEYPDDPESYVANMQAAIAAAVDAGVTNAVAAWNRYAQNSNAMDFVTSPQFAIEPRDLSGNPPPPPAPTVNLSANPTSVQTGGNSQLSWSSTNATSCTASGAWSGTKATSGNQSVGPLTVTGTYTLSCTGTGGSAQRSVTITVTTTPPPPTPTVTLSANPAAVQTGGNSQLTWSSTNATSCTASGAWSGTKATSGNQSVGPLTATGTYTLSCTGTGGSAQQSVTVTVTTTPPPPPPPPPPAPTVTLTASPTSVAVNGTSTLTWSSTNATSCTASGSWSGAKATSGSESTSALTNTATYTLACSGGGGSAEQSVTVTVTPGGGGGGSGSGGSSGGGALGWVMLGALACALRRRALIARIAGSSPAACDAG